MKEKQPRYAGYLLLAACSGITMWSDETALEAKYASVAVSPQDP